MVWQKCNMFHLFLVLNLHFQFIFWVLEILWNISHISESLTMCSKRDWKLALSKVWAYWLPKGKLYVGRETRLLFFKVQLEDAWFKNNSWLRHHHHHHHHYHNHHHHQRHHQQHIVLTQLNKVLPRCPPWKQSIKPCYNPCVRALTLHWKRNKYEIQSKPIRNMKRNKHGIEYKPKWNNKRNQ